MDTKQYILKSNRMLHIRDVSSFKRSGAKNILLHLWSECQHLVKKFPMDPFSTP